MILMICLFLGTGFLHSIAHHCRANGCRVRPVEDSAARQAESVGVGRFDSVDWSLYRDSSGSSTRSSTARFQTEMGEWGLDFEVLRVSSRWGGVSRAFLSANLSTRSTMRHGILFVFVSIVSMTAGTLLRPFDDVHSSLRETQMEQPCVAQDDGSAAPESIDDREIKQHIQRAGGAIADEGAATEMAELIKQLSVRECELELPRVTLKPPEDGLLYEQAKQSVLVVSAIYKCDRCNNWHAGCATGFVISPSGAVVTNYHVVEKPDNSALVAMTADGKVLPVKRVLAANKADDLAILELDVQDQVLTPLPVARSRAPIGSNVSVISHPGQRYFCYTSGVVSRYTRLPSKDGPANAMTITADFARGSSGAPVLNDNGEVVGIVRSTESIYYKVEKGQQQNLQMVLKTCVPSASLLELIAPTPPPLIQ